MSEGFEEAKTRRNWLERLGERIPGFRGFQDRELRRDVDRLQREHVARELERLRAAVRGKARLWADAGKLGILAPFDRLERKLDGLGQAVRFADYGASGFFDVVKFGEAELDALYRFDLELLDDLAGLAGDVAAIPGPSAADPTSAVEAAAERAQAIEDRWQSRKAVVSGVVRTAG